MSNYLPHYTKKKTILDRKEQQLLRLLQRSEDELTVLLAAVAVRDARVRVLRAQYEMIPPQGTYEGRLLKMKEQIHAAESASAEAIVAELRTRMNNDASSDSVSGDGIPHSKSEI